VIGSDGIVENDEINPASRLSDEHAAGDLVGDR